MGQGRVAVFLMMGAALAACAKSPATDSPASTPPAAERAEEASLPTERGALARYGLALLEQKRHAEASAALEAAAAIYPEVAPFLRVRVAEADAARGELDRAAAVLSQIIALDQSSAATVARLRLPAIYARLGDEAATNAAWQQAMSVAIDELTEADFVSMAKALADSGRNDLASQTRMRLLRDYTNGRHTEQMYGHLKAEVAALPLDEKIALATKLSRANRYDQALDLFQQIPESTAAARATRLRALFNSRHYGTLLEETDATELKDPSLILLRARAAWRDDKPEELLAGLNRVIKEFPGSPQEAEARVVRAKYYTTDVVDYARAVEDLTKAINAGAAGNDGENLWNLGWTHTLAGKYAEALATFDRYIRAYPDGDWKTNSLFWSAKIHDRQGRTAQRDAAARQLVAEYPYSYYAWRLRELWPEVVSPEPSAPTTAAAFPDIEAQLRNVADARFVTVAELQEIGLHRSAAREMKLLAQAYPDNAGVQFLLADVYVRGGEPFKANGVLQRQFRQFVRHGGTNIPPRFWQILFPLAYWETLQAEGQRRGIDPYLLASITRQESGFEPTTVSNAGAVGLMQIMPEEASRIASAAGLGEITRDDLFDPLTNIAVGAAEYSQKLSYWNGNHVLAIASYNAGERAVGTWIEKTPVDDYDLFVESIPYAETRLYVKTVSRNRFEYRRIYESTRATQPPSAPAQ